MNAVATIAVNSDTSTLLNALSKTFSRSSTVLGELLQNGRRAGATRIDVTVSDDLVTVTDNGCGIEDFSVLLSIAKSGWDSTVQRVDAPYGIGFTACLFACQNLEVESRGRGFRADTADLIALRPVGVLDAGDDAAGTTRIALHGQKIGDANRVSDALRVLARGFPIPVALNGELLDRPCALDRGVFIATPVGMVSPAVLTGEGVSRFYLQGLPICVGINVAAFRSRIYESDTSVIHLDSTLFEGRMPDRDALLNPESSSKAISDGLAKAAVTYLTQLVSTMDEVAFVKAHGDLAASLNMRDLLNAMECIPRTWVSVICDDPYVMASTSPSFEGTPTADVVTRANLLESGLYSASTGDDHEENLIAMHAVSAIDGYLTTHYLPGWHWASAMIKEVRVEDFTMVAGEVIGTDKLEIFGETVTLKLVESLHIGVVNPSVMGDKALLPATVLYAPIDGVLFATDEASGRTAVTQVSAFEDDDRYDEEAFDQAESNFLATVAVLRDKDPAVLLDTFLRAGLPYSMPEVLRGQTFTVKIDAVGAIQTAVAAAGCRDDLVEALRVCLKLIDDNADCLVVHGDSHPDRVNAACDGATAALQAHGLAATSSVQ